VGKKKACAPQQSQKPAAEQVWCLIGSGPSLTAAQVEAVKDQNVVATNDNWRWMRHWSGPARRAVYACDPDWWDHWHAEIECDAELWTQDKGAAQKYNLNHIESKALFNLSARDSGFIHQGRNSGFQAMNLAYLWGATKIILLGYEMQVTDKTHWFGDHPKQLQRKSPYAGFISAFKTIEVGDCEIINCSINSALDCFPKMSIEDAL